MNATAEPPFFHLLCCHLFPPCSFNPSVCFSSCLAPTPPCSPYLPHTVFLRFLRPTLHKPKPRWSLRAIAGEAGDDDQLCNQRCVFTSEQMFWFHADFQSLNGGDVSVDERKQKTRGLMLPLSLRLNAPNAETVRKCS